MAIFKISGADAWPAKTKYFAVVRHGNVVFAFRTCPSDGRFTIVLYVARAPVLSSWRDLSSFCSGRVKAMMAS